MVHLNNIVKMCVHSEITNTVNKMSKLNMIQNMNFSLCIMLNGKFKKHIHTMS